MLLLPRVSRCRVSSVAQRYFRGCIASVPGLDTICPVTYNYKPTRFPVVF
jgi:hypothetical protein